MEVVDNSTTVGYAWLHHAATPDVVEFHACSAKGQEGRWLTPHVLDQMFKTAINTGATYVIAQITSPRVASLWTRLGGTVVGAVMVLTLKEKTEWE